MMRFFTFLLLALSLSSCTKAGDLDNFHQVEDDLARGAQPSRLGMEKLRSFGIRTILKLNEENLGEEREAAKALGINFIYEPLSGLLAPSETEEMAIQAVLWNPALRPLYFHCSLGKDRTGLAAALYRVKRQGWSASSAHKEWMALGHSPLLFLMDRFFQQHTE